MALPNQTLTPSPMMVLPPTHAYRRRGLGLRTQHLLYLDAEVRARGSNAPHAAVAVSVGGGDLGEGGEGEGGGEGAVVGL